MAVAAVLWHRSMGLAVICWRIFLDLVPCTSVCVCVCERQKERDLWGFPSLYVLNSHFFLFFFNALFEGNDTY